MASTPSVTSTCDLIPASSRGTARGKYRLRGVQCYCCLCGLVLRVEAESKAKRPATFILKYPAILSRCSFTAKMLRTRINSGIVMHQDSDRDAALVLIEPFHPHHVPDLFAVHGIVRAEIESQN